MEFQDFCRYFTDVVVCRLAGRTLLWPSSHWREVKCYGEWVLALPLSPAPPPTALHSNTTRSKNVRPEGTQQRGNREEAQLGETLREGGKRGIYDPRQGRRNADVEANRSQEELMDRRSRCGGCINHRDTFLQNPQVQIKKTD